MSIVPVAEEPQLKMKKATMKGSQYLGIGI